MEQLRLLKKKLFGTSSEQSKEQLDGQRRCILQAGENQTGAQRSRSSLGRRDKGAG